MLAHTLAVGLLAAQLTGIAFTFLARTPPHPRSERARWALAAIGVFFSDMPALVCMVDTVVLLLAWRCGVLFDTGVVGRACAAVGAVLLVLLAAVFVEGFVVTRGLVVRVLAGVQKHGSVVEGPEVIQRSLLWSIPFMLQCLVPIWRPWDIVEHRDITYATPEELKQAGPGAEKYMQLDLLRRGSAVRKRPVYIYYHGGAWTIGDKRLPVNPICWEMASRGWIVINVNYRMAPRSRYPEILIDCKRALRWVKENVAKYGGDPDFVAVGGGSAGGHLAAMLALTPNRKDFQPGFESTDTRISAALLSYPVVDVTNASGYALPGFPFWFAHKICGLPHSPSPTPWLLKNACPLAAIPSAAAEARRKNGDDHPSIPPTMVVHGANDNVVGKGTVRCFVDSLRGVDGVDVAYLEVPGAHHGFDCFSGAKTTLVHWAGGEFLDAMWARSRCRA